MRILLLCILSFSLLAENRWDAYPQSDYSKFMVGEKVKDHSLFRNGRLTVLVAFDADCPMSKKLAPSLGRLEKMYDESEAMFIHISVNSSDSQEKVRQVFKDRGFSGQLYFDKNKEIQQSLKLRTTTEAVLIDSSGTIIYRGAINDQYGVGFTRDNSSRQFLIDAINSTLNQQLPKIRLTSAPGCLLEFENLKIEKLAEVTFHNQVSRILQNHCQSCHRKGGVGPFELIDYDEVKERRKMIKYVVEKKIMPPWFAEEGGPWVNDCSLSKKDEKSLLDWIANKCPEGNEKEAPVPLKWDSKWQLTEPDFILKLPRSVKVPAEGRIPYINVFVQIPFTENCWISAMEIRSEQPQVLHHVLIMDDKSGSKVLNKRRLGGGVQGFLGGLVPGQSLTEYPAGTGKVLRAGSWLKFQLHYTPNGKVVEDNISLALKFHDKRPSKEMLTVSAFNARFAIPPHNPNYTVKSEYRFPVNATVIAFSPHTHLRGKAFKYELQYPNGKREVVLDVPNYDFNWQLRYILQKPLKVPRGSKMVCTAVYDNSSKNPANPNPNARVRFGDQTEDEMMIGYFEGFIGY